jgi:hypothetical protein
LTMIRLMENAIFIILDRSTTVGDPVVHASWDRASLTELSSEVCSTTFSVLVEYWPWT